MSKQDYLKILTCAETEDTSSVINKMSIKNNEYVKGIVAVISNENKFIGCFADGDLRRIINDNADLNLPISNFMVRNPISVMECDIDDVNTWNNIKDLEVQFKKNVKTIFVLNDQKELLGALNRNYYISEFLEDFQNTKSCIMGLGFVGLTVACHISSYNMEVIGYDNSLSLVDDLKNNKTKFDEPGLSNMINDSLGKGLLDFTNEIPKSDIYMISVGSPISDDGVPDLSQILSCLDKITSVIKPGILIIIRSTIPLGSCREVFIPYLEKASGLSCGVDWHLSFAPERTLEGSALQELRNLPQIVSGFSDDCLRKSSNYFRKFCKNIVEVESLESAELAKLACNTYRDLKFSFANELSNICETYNINARRLISKINFDYDRADIPLPSPGVGGYCLTKDPIIYTHPSKKPESPIELGKISRKINNYALGSPNRALKKFCSTYDIKSEDINILIIGLAFKGTPETNDVRFSTSIDFYNSVSPFTNKVYGFDNCLSQNEIQNLGFEKDFDINKIDNYDITGIFFLNNHRKNSNVNLLPWLNSQGLKFVFDGWGCREDLEENDFKDFTYMTLGMLDC